MDKYDATVTFWIVVAAICVACVAYNLGYSAALKQLQKRVKPKDRRRNLVRAAALLIAEIERIDRSSRED